MLYNTTTGFRTSVNFFLPRLRYTEPVEIVVVSFFFFLCFCRPKTVHKGLCGEENNARILKIDDEKNEGKKTKLAFLEPDDN